MATEYSGCGGSFVVPSQRRTTSAWEGVQLVGGRLLLARGRRPGAPAGPRVLSRRRLATIVDVDATEEERLTVLQEQATRYLSEGAEGGRHEEAESPPLGEEDD